MTQKQSYFGHAAALITIFIWGTTFISTKVLLDVFTPVEILFFRFSLGYLALWLARPKLLHTRGKEEEIYFIFAGLSGVTLYFLFENIALTYTTASNVGIIVSISPFFTALLSWLFLKEKKPGKRFYLGFVLAMSGIWCLSGAGNGFSFHFTGDILAILAALAWATYSLLTKKISSFGYHVLQTTRRTFFYGLLLMLPAIALLGFRFDPIRFADPKNLLNILFLGFGASALCFVTWNFAVKVLGAVKTVLYIYIVPVVTVVTAVLILHEEITLWSVAGILLTLAGLAVSQEKTQRKEPSNEPEMCNDC